MQDVACYFEPDSNTNALATVSIPKKEKTGLHQKQIARTTITTETQMHGGPLRKEGKCFFFNVDELLSNILFYNTIHFCQTQNKCSFPSHINIKFLRIFSCASDFYFVCSILCASSRVAEAGNPAHAKHFPSAITIRRELLSSTFGGTV